MSVNTYDNGIVVGFIGGKDYVSQDNGDGTHSLICPVGDVPEIKRNHDRLKQENTELREALQATVDISERFVVHALTLAKHDYPLSPSSGMQLTDWKKHEHKLKQLLNK